MISLKYLLTVQSVFFFMGILLLFYFARIESGHGANKKRRRGSSALSTKHYAYILIGWFIATVGVVLFEIW